MYQQVRSVSFDSICTSLERSWDWKRHNLFAVVYDAVAVIVYLKTIFGYVFKRSSPLALLRQRASALIAPHRRDCCKASAYASLALQQYCTLLWKYKRMPCGIPMICLKIAQGMFTWWWGSGRGLCTKRITPSLLCLTSQCKGMVFLWNSNSIGCEGWQYMSE